MMLPDGWKQSCLGEVCSIEIGGTPSRGVTAYWDSAHDTSNVWVSIRDMRQRLITGSAEQISDLGIKKSNVKLQQPGTVLLSFKLSIGRVAIAAVPLFTNEAIVGLSPTGLTRDFLFHGLQGWDLLQGVDQAIKGATLNKQKLKKILFEYPESEREQSKIAEVLSTVDQAIEKTEALIAKQQRIKTGLMQDLLTRGIDEHGNLRSEATHEFKDSPLGRIPVEWDIASLGSVSECVTSGPRGWAKYYREDGVPFIRIGNLTREHINLQLDDLVFVQPPESAEGLRTATLTDDLLISVTADLGVIGVIPKGFAEGYVNQHIALVRLRPTEVSVRFIGWFLSSREGKAQFDRLNESGAKAGLNLPTVRSLLFPRPDIDEQYRIAVAIDAFVRTVDQHACSLRKLRALKRGLMQDLLTGNRRVTALLKQGEGGSDMSSRIGHRA